MTAAARFIGAGNFSALATQGAVAYQIQATFAGAGSISADSSKYKLAAATFAGSWKYLRCLFDRQICAGNICR